MATTGNFAQGQVDAVTLSSSGISSFHGFRFTAPSNGTLNSVKINIASFTTGGNVTARLYSNGSGHPGSLIASSAAVNITGTGDVTFNWSSPPNLTASTVYWIVFDGTGGGSLLVTISAATAIAGYDAGRASTATGISPDNYGANETDRVEITLAIVNDQTITATCSSTASVKKSPTKIIAISVAAAVSIIKGFVFQKIINAICSSSVAILTASAFHRIIGVSCSTSVSAFKSVVKRLSIASAGTVTISKGVSKIISVASAMAAAVVKRAEKSILSSCATATVMTRSVGKIVAAALSGAVTLKRSIGKNVNVASTSAVLVSKAISHTLTIASTGVTTITKTIAKPISVVLATTTAILIRAAIGVADALGVALVELLRLFAPTVRDRTIVVDREPRETRLAAALRRIEVERENRTIIVPSDPRLLH